MSDILASPIGRKMYSQFILPLPPPEFPTTVPTVKLSRQINDWVRQSTNGKINQIFDQITSDNMLFLLNAIYFNSKWTREFDKNRTDEYPFYLVTGGQKQHPMMSQTGKYRYNENQKFFFHLGLATRHSPLLRSSVQILTIK